MAPRAHRLLALPALALTLSGALVACTDSELGLPNPLPPRDTGEQDTAIADTADTTVPDTTVPDTTVPDTRDTVDVPDVGCTSNEQCRAAIGGLGPCDAAFCDPQTATCQVARRPDCCASQADCPSLGDPCLENRCPVPGGSCSVLDLCAPCQLDSDCERQAPACTAGRCSEGTCIFERLETCCIDAADCDDADVCTDATCEAGLCVHRDNGLPGCCANPPVLDTSFSPAPEFSMVSSAEDVGWFVRDTNFTPSPPAALYLGNRRTFVNTSEAGPHKAEARFRLGLVRPGAIEVKLQAYVDLRPTPEVDRLRVSLRGANGDERLVYSKAVATLGAWHPVKRSIVVESQGPWELVFTFEAVTLDAERHFGVLIDDLEVRTSCGAEGCQSDRECVSPDPCLIGSCDNGQCSFTPSPACGGCQTDDQCEDGRPCTQNSCRAGTCVAAPIPGCCNVDGDCADGDACTRDRCRPDAGICFWEPIPNCGGGCSSVAECDDNRLCTEDSCTADGRCLHQPRPGCCEADFQCNDNDPCTADRCDAATGLCRHERLNTPQCNPCPNGCNDNNPCTIDRCDASGQCVREPIQGCCVGDSQCSDGNACTADACVQNRCTFNPIPGCSACPNACNDNNPCTADKCDEATGQCFREQIPGCCSANTQCNDNNACTADACTNNRCTFTPIPGCSACPNGCNDNNPCTADRCDEQTGQCRREPIPGCCVGNQQCADNNPCTTDTCANNRCTYTPSNAPGCGTGSCQTDAECEDGAPCTANQCTNGQCRTLPILGCCQSTSDCNDSNACTNDFCINAAGTCVNLNVDCDDDNDCTIDRCDRVRGCTHEADPTCVCREEVLWKRSFVQGESPDIDTDGSGFGIRWRVDGVLPFSPNLSLRYGDEGGDNYSNDFRTFGRATGPTLAVSPAAGGVRLEFMLFLDIDVSPDSFRARVLFGNQNVIAWDHLELAPDLYGTWVPVSVDLPSQVIGQDIRIRFVLDSVDGEGNQGRGVAIDDIVVITTCP